MKHSSYCEYLTKENIGHFVDCKCDCHTTTATTEKELKGCYLHGLHKDFEPDCRECIRVNSKFISATCECEPLKNPPQAPKEEKKCCADNNQEIVTGLCQCDCHNKEEKKCSFSINGVCTCTLDHSKEESKILKCEFCNSSYTGVCKKHETIESWAKQFDEKFTYEYLSWDEKPTVVLFEAIKSFIKVLTKKEYERVRKEFEENFLISVESIKEQGRADMRKEVEEMVKGMRTPMIDYGSFQTLSDILQALEDGKNNIK